MTARPYRWVAVVATSIGSLAFGPAIAHAASSATITVGADPVESITTQVGASGSTSGTAEYLNLKIKPAGGTPCAANADADDGESFMSGRSLGAGSYAVTANKTFDAAGTYLVCAWLQSGSTIVTARDSKVVQVRIPTLSLSIAAPASVSPDQTFQVTTTTQAEASRDLYVRVVPDAGRGCPANAAAAYDSAIQTIISGTPVVGGPTATASNVSISAAGTYLLCGYLHYRTSSANPEATSTTSLVVVAPPQPPPPPPACVVPQVVPKEPLATTRGRVIASACLVGKVRYLASARYPRGTVFKLSPAPGTNLGIAGVVDLYVSTGSPCIVPSIPRSRSLASTQRALARAHCTAGSSIRRRSARVPRGRVVTLSPAPKTRLSPRAKVQIVVSSGRRQR